MRCRQGMTGLPTLKTKLPMRTDQARPVRLADYRPPDWLVETVELDIALDSKATRVRATLMLRPNGGPPAPLVLDGDAAPEHRDAGFVACANAVTRWADRSMGRMRPLTRGIT